MLYSHHLCTSSNMTNNTSTISITVVLLAASYIFLARYTKLLLWINFTQKSFVFVQSDNQRSAAALVLVTATTRWMLSVLFPGSEYSLAVKTIMRVSASILPWDQFCQFSHLGRSGSSISSYKLRAKTWRLGADLCSSPLVTSHWRPNCNSRQNIHRCCAGGKNKRSCCCWKISPL